MRIVDFLKPEAVLADLTGKSPSEVLAELCRPLAALHRLDAARLLTTLLERERLGSTSVGDGVAIPHGRLPGLPALVAGFGRSPGVDFHSVDGKPVRLFLVLFAPENAAGTHVKVLARVSRLFRSAAFREAILSAPDAAAIYRLIETEDAKE